MGLGSGSFCLLSVPRTSWAFLGCGPMWRRGWGAGERLLTPLSYLPSYPYSEDCSQGRQYMNTRCPAWCDRVLMSPSAKELVLRVSEA